MSRELLTPKAGVGWAYVLMVSLHLVFVIESGLWVLFYIRRLVHGENLNTFSF